jgi:hypothetical protein
VDGGPWTSIAVYQTVPRSALQWTVDVHSPMFQPSINVNAYTYTASNGPFEAVYLKYCYRTRFSANVGRKMISTETVLSGHLREIIGDSPVNSSANDF